jgi:NAD(P)-dependent dehydrogenase (short-subunit alcohol dehydrogenase family)
VKVALVTGASSGIGRATALAFVNAGIAVVALGRRREKLEDLVKAAGASRHIVAILEKDAMLDDAPACALQAALANFGRLDYLINNAGRGHPKPVHETDDAELDVSLNLMLRTPFRFIREALTVMESGAAIVNVASSYALVGGLRGGAYSAAKAGLLGLTTHVACQYGRIGIRCNAVAPGVIPTEMTAGRFEDEKFRRMNHEMTPAPRLGTVDDISGTILFLCSSAAEFINGQCIAVDGGWTTTKFLSEQALTAVRTDVKPDFTHSGRPLHK